VDARLRGQRVVTHSSNDTNKRNTYNNMNPNQMPEVEWSDTQNQQLLDQITLAPVGSDLTKIAAAGGQMLKRRIREFGFQRVILPYVTVQDPDLDKLPGVEEPVIIEEMEPKSRGAVTLPFNGTADTEFFFRDDFAVYFYKISTLIRACLRCAFRF
jgi:hypothetical protein